MRRGHERARHPYDRVDPCAAQAHQRRFRGHDGRHHSSMRLEVGCIDHHLAILSRCFCQFGKNIVEDAHPAPAQKTIVERLVRAILARRVFPLQAMFDDINDAADDFPVIDPRNTM